MMPGRNAEFEIHSSTSDGLNRKNDRTVLPSRRQDTI